MSVMPMRRMPMPSAFRASAASITLAASVEVVNTSRSLPSVSTRQAAARSEAEATAGVTEVWRVTHKKTGDALRVQIYEIIHDSQHDLGIEPMGLENAEVNRGAERLGLAGLARVVLLPPVVRGRTQQQLARARGQRLDAEVVVGRQVGEDARLERHGGGRGRGVDRCRELFE